MAVHSDDLETLLRSSTIDLTTTGRRSGEPRTVELSFVLKGIELFCLAGGGGRVHWYQNLLSDAHVMIGVEELRLKGRAVRRISHPKRLTRQILGLFREKYGANYVRSWYDGTDRAPVRIKILGRLD